ncbi:MAG: PEP-CTERM sorting domain-containing protein [Planctomycetaceae bacterium]|nr:PEP-CTERM sorting domain-containing protein [Planctomycetaceae bacterium]
MLQRRTGPQGSGRPRGDRALFGRSVARPSQVAGGQQRLSQVPEVGRQPLHHHLGITGLANPTAGGTLTGVPEPGSLTLAAIGVVCFAGMAWRKRKSAA